MLLDGRCVLCSYEWQHHDMGKLYVLLALCEWQLLITGGFIQQWPVMRIFDVLFLVNPNKLLNKQ